ncbi:MAG: hypothetical protein J6D28_04845 [Bacilli bacterium]|nr:hypothetical protein [Bacilli bacterium]
MELKLSNLNKTWIFDIDGTIVKHNGYKIDGYDTILDNAKNFFDNIPADDMIILVTSRTDEYRKVTEDFLHSNGIRYNHIIYNAPYGERILVNDKKPSGLNMAYAISTNRDEFITDSIVIDNSL